MIALDRVGEDAEMDTVYDEAQKAVKDISNWLSVETWDYLEMLDKPSELLEFVETREQMLGTQ